jgi:hypothetical protein
MVRMRVKAATKREAFRLIASETLDLKANRLRRFRNAILSLALSDPRWMIWVERTLPPHIEEICEDIDVWLMLVEAAARWRVLAAYGFFHNRTICHLVFRRDWAFTDRGTLSPG